MVQGAALWGRIVVVAHWLVVGSIAVVFTWAPAVGWGLEPKEPHVVGLRRGEVQSGRRGGLDNHHRRRKQRSSDTLHSATEKNER